MNRCLLRMALICSLVVAPSGARAEGGDLVLVVLRPGDAGGEVGAERMRELSAGHMANIDRLAEEGTLLIAGPLVSPEAQGIFVLDVPTLAEAREVVATDPAVAAGVIGADLSILRTPDPLRRLPELERAAEQAREARESGTGAAFEMRAWTLAVAPAGAATDAAVAALRAAGVVAFAGRADEGPDAGVWVALDAQEVPTAEAQLAAAGDGVEWKSWTWYGSAQYAHLPRLGVRADAPTFEILPITAEGDLAPFHGVLAQAVDVFGVDVVATAGVGRRELLHAAHLLAQYMDNDEDGELDDAAVHAALLEGGAFLFMAATERESRRLDIDWEQLEESGRWIGQDLYGEETLPEGPPHVRAQGRFDAALEEVWHLVSNGWGSAHPAAFAYEPGSRLCDAMDLSRGGRFDRPPRRYPDGAWYHYDDRTCDYGCMAAEYFYWTLTSLLGGQDYPGRAEEIAVEWECPTAALLEARDPMVHALLTDERWALPRVLPDGSYGP